MSLAETQQIMSMLQEIMQMLDGAEVQVKTLSDNIGYSPHGSVSSGSLRRELHIINMYTVALEKLSGSGDLVNITNKVQQLMTLIFRLYMLLYAVNILMTGITPFGLFYAGAQLIGAGIAFSNLGQ